MAAISLSDTLSFSHDSYNHQFNRAVNTSGASTNNANYNLLAYTYYPVISYWGFSGSSVYGKDYDSVILKITSYTGNSAASEKVNFSFTVGCMALGDTSNASAASNLVHLGDAKTRLGAYSSTFTIPAGEGASINCDISNVIQYAARNYNVPWGLYIFGGDINGSAGTGPGSISGSYFITDPEIVTATISEGKAYINIGSSFTQGQAYVHNGSNWVKAKGIYVHNGSTWVKTK